MVETQPKKNRETRLSVLRAIETYYEKHGITPTIREIGEMLGISSTSHITYHLKTLCEQGVIQRDPKKSRGIRLLRRDSGVLHIPVLGPIIAGSPIVIPSSVSSPYDPKSTVEIPEHLLAGITGDLYALKVKGDSMRDMLISEGDIVILRKTQQAQNGQIVAAWLKTGDDDEFTLKRYYLENGRVRLQPANPEYQPIIVSPDKVQIQGHVVMLYRSYL